MVSKMNDYQILKSIGVGSYGTVHLALHKQQQCHYVVKRLKIWGLKEDQKQKIDNEVKLLRDFQHVNIVRYRDSFIDKQGYLNIVMTNCEGGDMYQLVENAGGKKIPEKQIIDWAVQIALALYYMHQKKILHRDLKTSNIFLNNNRVRLGDFGISKVLDQKNDFLAQTNIGTPLYMSPEQFKNKPYSYKSDIWALGCVLYEMCNHKHAFTANSLQGLARKIFMGQFSPVSDYYSQQLRELIHKMLSQNPKGRPTIIQILQKPFMRRRVQAYIKQIMVEGNNDQQLVQKLIQQGKSLGIRVESESQRGNQSTPRKSSHSSSTSKNRQQSQQKLKKQRERVKEELQMRLKKQNDQKKKMQQKIKEIQRQRKQMSQAAKNKRKNSYDRVSSALGRNSSSSINQRKESSTSVSTHTPSVSNSSKVSKKQSANILPNQSQKAVQIDYQSKPVLKKQQSNEKKPFQMKEQHDMHYQDQQESDEDATFINAIIDQQVEQQQEQKANKQPLQKTEKIDKLSSKAKHEQLDESIRQQIVISNSYIKQEMVSMKQKQKQQIQQYQQSSIRQSIRPQVETPVQKMPIEQRAILSSPKFFVDENRIKQIQELRKQVKQKTAQINFLETELQAIDFQFSSDSQNQPNFGQQKRQNPTYIRVKQRVNDLKHRIIAKLGRDGYNKLMKYAYAHVGKQNQKTKEQLCTMVGKQLIGLWHIAGQIVTIQKILENTPQYF